MQEVRSERLVRIVSRPVEDVRTVRCGRRRSEGIRRLRGLENVLAHSADWSRAASSGDELIDLEILRELANPAARRPVTRLMPSLLGDAQTAAPWSPSLGDATRVEIHIQKERAEYSGNSAETCCQTADPEAEESRLPKTVPADCAPDALDLLTQTPDNVGRKRPSSRERGWGIRTHVHLLPLFYSGLKLSSSNASPSSIRDVGIAP